MRTLLETDEQARAFAQCAGAVCVVLGAPQDTPDGNSKELFELLAASSFMEEACETWLHQFYVFSTLDELLSDADRCARIFENGLVTRAAQYSNIIVSKAAATLAGLHCVFYSDVRTLVNENESMAAIAKNQDAMRVLMESTVAHAPLCESPLAYTAIFETPALFDEMKANSALYAAFQAAPGAVAAEAITKLAMLETAYTDINTLTSDSAAMDIVAASVPAMRAIIVNHAALSEVVTHDTAYAAIAKVDAAWEAVKADSTANEIFAKVAASTIVRAISILAGLPPDEYKDAAALVTSTEAMKKILANGTARRELLNSPHMIPVLVNANVALTKVLGNVEVTREFAENTAAVTAMVANVRAFETLLAPQYDAAMRDFALSEAAMRIIALNKTALKKCFEYRDAIRGYILASPAAIRAFIGNTNATNLLASDTSYIPELVRNEAAFATAMTNSQMCYNILQTIYMGTIIANSTALHTVSQSKVALAALGNGMTSIMESLVAVTEFAKYEDSMRTLCRNASLLKYVLRDDRWTKAMMASPHLSACGATLRITLNNSGTTFTRSARNDTTTAMPATITVLPQIWVIENVGRTQSYVGANDTISFYDSDKRLIGSETTWMKPNTMDVTDKNYVLFGGGALVSSGVAGGSQVYSSVYL